MYEQPKEEDLEERRCPKCGKLLGKSFIISGWIRVYCRKCKIQVYVSPRGASLATPSWVR